MIVWCNGDNLFHNVVIYLMLFFEDNFKLNFYLFGEIQYLLYVKKSFMVAYLFPEHKLLLELVVRLDFLCWPRAEIARTNVALCCSAPGYLPTYYCRSQNPLVPLGSIYVHTNTITHARTHMHTVHKLVQGNMLTLHRLYRVPFCIWCLFVCLSLCVRRSQWDSESV